MACDGTVFINRGRSPEVLSITLSKSSCRYPNTFFITLNPVSLISLYHSTFLYDILIFWGNQEVLDGVAFSEMYLCPVFTANVLRILTETSSVRHYHVYVVPSVAVSFAVAIGVFGVLLVAVLNF